MFLTGYTEQPRATGPRPISLGLSIFIHFCAIVLAVGPQAPSLPKPKSAYEQLIAGRERKIIWYHFKEKLPEVRPTTAKADRRPMRAEIKLPNQQIVSSPKNAIKAPQMILQKAPEINTNIKFDAANLVAVSLPAVEPPKQFVPPTPHKPKLYSPQIDTLTPPDLQADATKTPGAVKPVELAEVSRPYRDFKAPAGSSRKREAPKIGTAAPPDINAGVKPLEIAGLHEMPQVERPYREFKAPSGRPRAGPPQIRFVEPAQLPGGAAGGSSANSVGAPGVAETTLSKVYKPFEAPPSGGKSGRGGRAGVAVPVIPSAPSIDAVGNTPGELSAVVVGLNPGNQSLPAVSRPAAFSAGPKIVKDGGAGGNGSAAISVPDLTIRSGNIDTRATIMAKNTPPPRVFGRTSQADALREAAHDITVDEIGKPSGTRVHNAPDPGFEGRAVYMMAIQMPNITSYSGSWLMWYSERTSHPISTATITAPIVHRKVDPKYIAAAISERVEGTVRLRAVIHSDGTVGGIELARGIDERLNRTAEDALRKWIFSPAMRNGEPIDVDILVEIPFRLAPRAEN